MDNREMKEEITKFMLRRRNSLLRALNVVMRKDDEKTKLFIQGQLNALLYIDSFIERLENEQT